LFHFRDKTNKRNIRRSEIRRRYVIVCTFFILFISPLISQDAQITVEKQLDWKEQKIIFDLSYPLPQKGVNPSHRYQTEQYIESEAPELITESLGSLYIDSQNKLEDLLYQDPLFYTKVEHQVSELHKAFSRSTEDMKNFLLRYNVPFYPFLISLFVNENRESWKPNYFSALDYRREEFTGIIIYAQDKYPVHGENDSNYLQPALFPKIYNPQLDIIYQEEMVNYDELIKNGMVSYSREHRLSPSEWRDSAGSKPLLLSTRSIYGKLHTDIILSEEDCRLIMANEAENQLLSNGKVFILLAPEE